MNRLAPRLVQCVHSIGVQALHTRREASLDCRGSHFTTPFGSRSRYIYACNLSTIPAMASSASRASMAPGTPTTISWIRNLSSART
jgi:hypothetical protein